MIKNIRKKPITVQAIQWVGTQGNYEEIQDFTFGRVILEEETQSLIVPTLEGDHRADKTDWIIKGVLGEFYPCKDHVKQKSYDEV